MTPQPPNPRSVFGRAVELESAADRKAYLDEACAGAPEVRDRVEALLRAHEAAGGFLQPAAAGAGRHGQLRPVPGTAQHDRAVQAARGDRRRRHGRGVGRRPDRSRSSGGSRSSSSRPGWTRGVLARFEAERQALAMMDHPNIAKVLDAGTTAGRPAVLRHGTGEGHADHRVLRRPQADPEGSGWNCSCRSARRSSTPTRRASSTATSSRSTCWSHCTTTSRCRR